MNKLQLIRRHCTCLLPLAGWLMTCAVHAQSAPTQSDFGGVGLWQTPTARMADEGEVAFTASRTSPYTRYNFTLQPLPWLEGSFRYINVSNVRYGPSALSGNQSYKDKSIDAKVRLWRESHYLPALSVGIRDLGGTGLFSSEYVVANKRFGSLDASLGLTWGYMGARGDISNPFDIISDTPYGPVRMIGAGTLSQRVRSTPQSFNEITWDGNALEVCVRNIADVPTEAMQVKQVPEDALPPRQPDEPVAPVATVPRVDPPVH